MKTLIIENDINSINNNEVIYRVIIINNKQHVNKTTEITLTETDIIDIYNDLRNLISVNDGENLNINIKNNNTFVYKIDNDNFVYSHELSEQYQQELDKILYERNKKLKHKNF